MTVHSKHGGSEITARPYKGYAPIMYENKELNGKNILDAAQSLKNIGFTNVEYVPIYDCSSINDSNYNKVSGTIVDGKTLYYYYDCFAVDVPIKLTYHTTESRGGTSSDGAGTQGGNTDNGGNGTSQDGGTLWYDQDYSIEEGNFRIYDQMEFKLKKYSFTSNLINLECSLVQCVAPTMTVSFTGKAIVYYLSNLEGYTNCETTCDGVSPYKVYQNKETTFTVSIRVPNDINIVAITAAEFFMTVSAMVDGETMTENVASGFSWACSATA